ncbi:MAG: hypothetical protein C0597_14880 [Marinilabiliales bacterium]|nr:MAG: hypothetical protein C0597_14880 [Marinilabiliales bacterium]
MEPGVPSATERLEKIVFLKSRDFIEKAKLYSLNILIISEHIWLVSMYLLISISLNPKKE